MVTHAKVNRSHVEHDLDDSVTSSELGPGTKTFTDFAAMFHWLSVPVLAMRGQIYGSGRGARRTNSA